MEHHHNHDGEHVFGFYGRDEIATVSAVFSDYIEDLELKGNNSSVDPYHRGIANWDENEEETRSYTTRKPQNFLKMLRDYNDDTEQVVSGIMWNESDRTARIQQAAERYRFGYHVGNLIGKVELALEAVAASDEDPKK